MPTPKAISPKPLIAAILASAFVLSGCGIKGTLKTPPPVWGDEKPQPAEPETDTQTDEISG